MAEAAGHKFGQFIGQYCEAAIEPLLKECADRHGLFLDKKGPRPARTGSKLRWVDSFGNGHDLDYVLERGGTPKKIGTPVAFIECAWRRYTKHSKNKAQEIQGAVLPIAEKHRFSAPMLGCMLAGDYTSASLAQLKSVGFKVLYFTYDSVVQAFASVGADVQFDESTAEADFDKKIRRWAKIAKARKDQVWKRMLELNQRNVQEFMTHLERTIERRINSVRVIPLHGAARDCIALEEAIQFVNDYDETAPTGPLVKYEVVIRYDNGDKIDGEFRDKATAIEFLQAFQTGNFTPAIDAHDEDVE